ncbi:uncharacterized protein LOC141530862 [Cotesia typhae]|uniref:uncharacterized protein LOC141530862 n=1 Tax=Cotesia typhae TaxID=2053667 RepID=UPI003D69C4DE
MANHGMKAVFTAIRTHNIPRLKELLTEEPYLINCKNVYQKNLFEIVMVTHSYEILETLISFVSEDSIVPNVYMSLVWNLLQSNYLELLEKLLTKCKIINLNKSHYIHKILQTVITKKLYVILKLLTIRKVNLNISNCSKSPFYIACRHGDLEMVKMLLEGGANPNYKKFNLPDDSHYYAESFYPIHAAIYYNHNDILDELLSHGMDVNAMYEICGEMKFTSLLHFACASHKLEAVNLLLLRGADVNILDFDGLKPISITVNLPDEQFFLHLIQHKDFKLTFEDAVYIFEWTVEFHRYFRFQLLFEYLQKLSRNDLLKQRIYKELINNPDAKRPLLHRAARWNASECIDILLENGAKLELRNKYGRTATHVAFRYRQVESIKRLIENGADILAKCTRGFLPITYVYERKLVENRYETDEEIEEEDEERRSDDRYTLLSIVMHHALRLHTSGAVCFPEEFHKFIRAYEKANPEYKKRINFDELELMKQKVIKDSVSYYHFIVADVSQKAKYLEDPFIYQTLNNRNNYRYLFKDFAAVITYAFQSGLREKKKQQRLTKS